MIRLIFIAGRHISIQKKLTSWFCYASRKPASRVKVSFYTGSAITDSAVQTLTPQNGHLIKILVSLYFAITSDVAMLAIFFIAYLSPFKFIFLFAYILCGVKFTNRMLIINILINCIIISETTIIYFFGNWLNMINVSDRN